LKRARALLVCLTAAALVWPAVAAPSPTVDPKIAALAKEWFFRFQRGDVDRAQFTEEVNRELTDAMVRHEAAVLQPFGTPTGFVFVASAPIGAFIGYDFVVTFRSNKRIKESIALDNAGKIAGVNFRIYAPR